MNFIASGEKLNHRFLKYLEISDCCPVFRHPFLITSYGICSADGISQKNLMINQTVTACLEMASEHERNKNYQAIIQMAEGPFKLSVACKYLPFVAIDEYWRLVSQVWQGSTAFSRSTEGTWLGLFSNHGNPTLNDGEFIALPDRFHVYRSHDMGCISWVLSKDIAEQQANQYGEPEPILSGTVEKRHVLHFSHGSHGGIEVIVNPYNINIHDVE